MGDGTGALSDVLARTESAPRVAIRCEYCCRTSLKLQSNCGGCGAALPMVALMYSNEILDGAAARYLGMPGQNIPVDLSQLSGNQKLSDYVQSFLESAKKFTGTVSFFKV
jgi:hypothetical protein